MGRTKKPSVLKVGIVKVACSLFFENGFSKTTPQDICKEANTGTGHLWYYFPTKEHLLASLVQLMIDFQWEEMENETKDEGRSRLLAYCLELTTLVAIGNEVPQMQEFFVAAYSHPLTLDLIRANDVEKVKRVFAEYTQDWNDDNFTEIEAIVSGIEYATLANTEHSASVERRIECGINAILLLFGVPEEIRKKKIEKLLSMDYRAVGMEIYRKFKAYVTETNEHALEELLKAKSKA